MIPSPLEDMAAIAAARTPDDLWRWLVVNPHMRASLNTFDAVVAFKHLHTGDARHALLTAQLLCTDQRWRRLTRQLVGELEETGILAPEELDRLADGFLWHDRFAWPVPGQWLRDGTVRVNRGRAEKARDRPAAVVKRSIRPGLRRWAACRIVSGDTGRSAAVLDRAAELDAPAGDAVMAGLLDAAAAYPPEARRALVELGCQWFNGAVRLHALKLLAAADRRAAAERAARDPSATVRRWGERLASDLAGADAADGPRDAASGPPPAGGQPSLFD